MARRALDMAGNDEMGRRTPDAPALSLAALAKAENGRRVPGFNAVDIAAGPSGAPRTTLESVTRLLI